MVADLPAHPAPGNKKKNNKKKKSTNPAKEKPQDGAADYDKGIDAAPSNGLEPRNDDDEELSDTPDSPVVNAASRCLTDRGED